VLTGATPASPSRSTRPTITGTAESGSTVTLYAGPCTGTSTASGTAAQFASPGIQLTIPANATTPIHAKATDAAGNVSACSAPIAYTSDTTAPAAPTLTDTAPASPSNARHPKVLGAAEAGSTVTLYPTSDCTGTPLVHGSATALASPGIAITAPADTTTQISATTKDKAGNVSRCSNAITYVEDSTAPSKPTITGATPAPPSTSTTPTITGTAQPGATVTLYAGPCSGTPAATGTAAAFASPGIQITIPAHATTQLHATATDAAGNKSACSAAFAYHST
jgi:hypothetical protein